MLMKKCVVPKSWQILYTTKSLVHFSSSISSAAITADIKNDVEWEKAKPFKAIPGPTVFEVVRWFLPGGE